MTDLVFRTPAGGTDLVFGKSEPVAGEVYPVSVSGLFPPLVASMRVAIAYGARIHAVLPDATAHAVVSYRSEVSRPVVGNLQDDAGPGVAVAVARTDRATPAERRQGGARVAYGEGIALQSSTGVAWQDAAYRDSTLRAAFEDATGVGYSVRTAYQHAIATHQILGSAFEEARREARHLGASYQDALREVRLRIGGAYQEASRQSRMLAAAGHVASPASHARRHRYQEAMSPRRGVRSALVVPPRGCYTPPPGGAVHLLFGLRRSASAEILFRCGIGAPSASLIIPSLRVYIVINSASLTRVSNNLPLPVTGLSIAIDADSAHWTWSATLPLRALADLEPDAPGDPVELEAMVNGHAWRLLVERLAESERFGQASLQIGGRGIAAELSDPIYPVVSHGNPDAAAMAQQLAAAALSINGVPLGWGLDWTAADWLVPAGAWVHRGTPLDAVARIAAAAGAYVQAAPASRSLHVRPRYPLAPWDWDSAAPDIVLPADAVMERGTEHALRPAYDSVYVSGEAGGVLARVKRTGFAGNTPAPMVVDALVTHADAARGRGLEVLGNTGTQRIVTLETGILPASGVIHVGSLLDWTRGAQVARGLVRRLAVSATAGNADAPVKVRQTVGVEVHD